MRKKKDAPIYQTIRINLLGEKRALQTQRGRCEELGDHLIIQMQRLIEKKDFFNGELINNTFREKGKFITRFALNLDAAYALCFLLALSLNLKIDDFLEDKEIMKVLTDDKRVAEVIVECRKMLKR